MDCPACQTYRRRVLIRSTPHMRYLVRQLQVAVAARRLQCESLRGNRRDVPPPPFATLRPAEPLPELLHYYFSCPACRRIFALLCDTYAGAGGQWWVAGRLPLPAPLTANVPGRYRANARSATSAGSAGSPAAPTGSPASG